MSDTVNLLFVGDVNPAGLKTSKSIKEFFSTFDGSIINLEGYLNNDAIRNKETLGFTNSQLMETLRTLNVIAVNVANNHILDGGIDKYKELLTLLADNGILVFGTRNSPCAIISIKSINIGLCSFVWRLTGICSKELNCVYFNAKKQLNIFKNTQKKSEFTVIYPHWGIDFEILPHPWQVRLARKFVDAGADIVIGHHSHTIQPVEVYSKKPIFYSIGNFYMPRNDITWYWPKEVNGICISVAVNRQKFKYETFKITQIGNEVSLKYIKCKKNSYVPIREYERLFRHKRVKKIIPIINGNMWDLLKVPIIEVLFYITGKRRFRLVWKKIKMHLLAREK